MTGICMWLIKTDSCCTTLAMNELEREEGNFVIDAVISGRSGSMEVINSHGEVMLAGYASVPSSGWGVVA